MDVKLFVRNRKLPGLVITIKKHKVTIGFLVLFFTGLITGTLMIRLQSPISSLVVSMFQKYNGLIISNSFFNNFINLLNSNLFVVTVLYFLGFSALGSPFTCLVPYIKGIGTGIVSSYLYQTYLLKGFGYCMIVFFPQQIINLLALTVAMNESFINSKMIYKTINNSSQNSFNLKVYNVRFIFVTTITLLSSLLGALLNTYTSAFFIK